MINDRCTSTIIVTQSWFRISNLLFRNHSYKYSNFILGYSEEASMVYTCKVVVLFTIVSVKRLNIEILSSFNLPCQPKYHPKKSAREMISQGASFVAGPFYPINGLWIEPLHTINPIVKCSSEVVVIHQGRGASPFSRK